MGNCLKTCKVTAAHDDPSEEEFNPSEPPAPAPAPAPALKKTGGAKSVAGAKKAVRFRLQDDDDGDSGDGCGGGVVRIKVVVSQKELKRILNDTDNGCCSLEQVLAELRIKGRIFSDGGTKEDAYGIGSWRPVLESIPEELH